MSPLPGPPDDEPFAHPPVRRRVAPEEAGLLELELPPPGERQADAGPARLPVAARLLPPDEADRRRLRRQAEAWSFWGYGEQRIREMLLREGFGRPETEELLVQLEQQRHLRYRARGLRDLGIAAIAGLLGWFCIRLGGGGMMRNPSFFGVFLLLLAAGLAGRGAYRLVRGAQGEEGPES